MAEIRVQHHQLQALSVDQARQEKTRSEINAKTTTTTTTVIEIGNQGQRSRKKLSSPPQPSKTTTIGPVEALRSDDSIIPLSTQPIDSATSDELQTIVTTKSSAISVANSKTMHNNASNQKQKRRSSLLCGLGSSRDDTEDSDNSVPETAPLPGQLAGQVLSDEPIPTPFSDWMANLPLHLHELPFNQVMVEIVPMSD